MIKRRLQQSPDEANTAAFGRPTQRDVISNKTIAYSISAVVGVTVAAVIALLLYIPIRDSRATLDIIRTAGSLGIGTGGVFGLVIAARKQRSTERDLAEKTLSNDLERESLEHQVKQAVENSEQQRKVADENKHDAMERRVTEMYSNAAEHLDSKNPTVRLAGLYTLERLAQHHHDHRQTVVNLICGYLRDPYTPPKRLRTSRDSYPDTADSMPDGADSLSVTGKEDEIDRERELEVRKTAQRLIKTHLCPPSRFVECGLSYPEADHAHQEHGSGSYPEDFWGPQHLDLSGASLIDIDLDGCQFKSATFDEAEFFGDTRIHSAEISGDAMFRSCNFYGRARFGGTYFGGYLVFHKVHFEVHPVDFAGAMIGGGARFMKLGFRPSSWKIIHLDGSPIETSPIDMRGARFRLYPWVSNFSAPLGWEVCRPSESEQEKLPNRDGRWGFVVRSENQEQEKDSM